MSHIRNWAEGNSRALKTNLEKRLRFLQRSVATIFSHLFIFFLSRNWRIISSLTISLVTLLSSRWIFFFFTPGIIPWTYNVIFWRKPHQRTNTFFTATENKLLKKWWERKSEVNEKRKKNQIPFPLTRSSRRWTPISAAPGRARNPSVMSPKRTSESWRRI